MSDKLVYLARTAKFGEARATRKLAMIALCNAAGDHGEGCDADLSSLMETAEVSARTAKRIRAEFVRVGLLVLVHEGGRGRRDRAIFRLDVGRLEALSSGALSYVELLAHAGPDPDTVKGDTVSPLEAERVKPSCHPKAPLRVTNKGDIKGDTKGDTGPSLSLIHI